MQSRFDVMSLALALAAEAKERQRAAGEKNLENHNKGLVAIKRCELDTTVTRCNRA